MLTWLEGCRQCQAALAKGGPPAQGLGQHGPGRHQLAGLSRTRGIKETDHVGSERTRRTGAEVMPLIPNPRRKLVFCPWKGLSPENKCSGKRLSLKVCGAPTTCKAKCNRCSAQLQVRALWKELGESSRARGGEQAPTRVREGEG